MASNLLNRAMTLLSQRDHSEYELRRKLAAQLFSEDSQKELETVIAYCHQSQWLDDASYAERYLAVRARKGYGPQKIKAELYQRGIKQEFIDVAFINTEICWCEVAKKVTEKRFRIQLPLDWNDKASIKRYLYSRGFSSEEINTVFDEFI